MADPHESVFESARAGDPIAIEVLLERHLPGLQAFLRLNAGKIVRQRESVADLAQSVCRSALEDIGDFEYRGEAAFRHWLFSIARSKLVDRVRHWKSAKRDVGRDAPKPAAMDGDQVTRFEQMRASMASPSQFAMAREELDLLERAFPGLSDDHRDVIVMARVIGYSHAEIAARTGRTEAATRQLLRRALVQLGQLMRDAERRDA